MKNRIFSVDNPKAVKAKGYGYLNAIHYMAPAGVGGTKNLCPDATPGCKALCLGWESGQAGMVANDSVINPVRQSRIDKANRFMRERMAYMADVVEAIEAVLRKAKREGLVPCIRMNGSTDVGWHMVKCLRNGKQYESVMHAFPEVQFVDYTKSYRRMIDWCHGKLPKNYHLTFSRSELNTLECLEVLMLGGTVAAVFGHALPEKWREFPVIDGDKHDLRHLDPKGVVVGLSPKGRKAKADTSGFVIR